MRDWRGDPELMKAALAEAGADRVESGAFDIGPGPGAITWLIPDRLLGVSPTAEYYIDGEPHSITELLYDLEVPQGARVDEPEDERLLPLPGDHGLTPEIVEQLQRELDRRQTRG